ncbi:MAG: histidine kinase, partial [Marinilabiliales bacterium]
MKTTGIGTFYLFIAGILLNVLFYQSQLFAQNPYLGRYADTVKIGSELNYPPFCMVDEDGEAIGFSVDLFKASAKEVNLKINIKVAQWNVLKEDLAEGHLDALPLVGRSIERDSLFDFTFPYYTMHGAIFVRSDFNEFLTEEDLQGREIGVMEGDNAHDFLIKKGCVNIKTAPTFREVFENLSKGKYDAVVAQKLMGIELLEKLHIENVKPLPFMLKGFNQDFGFAVKNGNS